MMEDKKTFFIIILITVLIFMGIGLAMLISAAI